MSEYIGKKCLICGKTFTDKDEIVVCPECGTPYHRACYDKVGKCINTELHETHSSWKAEQYKDSKDSTETTKCPTCGTENPKTALFCTKCGIPLNGNKASGQQFNNNIPPFQNINDMMSFTSVKINDDTDIDGIKAKDFNDYVGKNNFYYLTNFIRFAKSKSKFSLNFTSFFFPELYFFYRKMNLIGSLFFVLRFIIMFFSITLLSSVGTFDGTALENLLTNIKLPDSSLNFLATLLNFATYATGFAASFFANFLYYKKAKKDINEINNLGIDSSDKTELIKKRGGTSLLAMIIAAVLPSILILIISYI